MANLPANRLLLSSKNLLLILSYHSDTLNFIMYEDFKIKKNILNFNEILMQLPPSKSFTINRV